LAEIKQANLFFKAVLENLIFDTACWLFFKKEVEIFKKIDKNT
jgi:hypothetical protein